MRIQFSHRIQYGQIYRGRPRYGQSYRNDYGRGNFRDNVIKYQRENFRGQNIDVDIEEIVGTKIMKEVEVGLRERTYSDNFRRNDRSSSNGRSRSGSRVSTNRDRIGCYNCREYDNFTKDCPTTVRRKRDRTYTVDV